MDGHIEVEFIARRIVVIRIHRNRNPVDIAGEDGICLSVLFHDLGRVAEADRHLRQPVIVRIIEQEWVFPVHTDIVHAFGRTVYLHESTPPVIIFVEIRQAVMYPAAESERIPVDIVEHVVLIRIHYPHIMSVAGLHPVCFGDIIDHNLHGWITVFIFAYPVDDKITITSVDTVFITVYHQAVVIGITFQITELHIVVIIDPLHRNTVGRHRTQDIRITISVQVYIGRLVPCGSRR